MICRDFRADQMRSHRSMHLFYFPTQSNVAARHADVRPAAIYISQAFMYLLILSANHCALGINSYSSGAPG